MSSELIHEIEEEAASAAVDAAWSQWAALTPLASKESIGPAETIVDPEALVLASLALSRYERRLEDIVAAWAREAGFLMSKPRFKSILERFPSAAEVHLGDFARYALGGGDSRWKSWAEDSTAQNSPRTKSLGPIRLQVGPSLMLRMRAGFGIGAKADILSMLLGLHGQKADLMELAAGTAYTERMVRIATGEMTLAGIVIESEGRPSSFHVDVKGWKSILTGEWSHSVNESPIPPWGHWATAFGLLVSITHWCRRADESNWSEYVAGSRLRDLLDQFEIQLARMGLRLGFGTTRTGENYLEFGRTLVEQLRRRFEGSTLEDPT